MQYSFIYQALLEYFLYGDTELDVSSLEGHLHKLHNTFASGDRVGLEEEFKVRSVASRSDPQKITLKNILTVGLFHVKRRNGFNARSGLLK